MFGILLLFAHSSTWACSCVGEMSVKKALKKNDIVFIGKVISMEKITITQNLSGTETNINHYFYRFTFTIEKRYKGKVKTSAIEITTGVGSGDCGYKFEIGKSYVVYANKRKRYFNEGPKVKTFLYTDVCERTTVKVAEEKNEIEKYRKFLFVK
ncbi:hypothetical protein [Chitinophaga caeni]|nr:hypothetical protein [Chitinophaga caeni]